MKNLEHFGHAATASNDPINPFLSIWTMTSDQPLIDLDLVPGSDPTNRSVTLTPANARALAVQLLQAADKAERQS